nr:hypothetical protein GCM10025732_21550 [Glycomyces mayteni]
MAGELADHAVSEAGGVRLDDLADDVELAAGLDGLDAAPGGLPGALDEVAGLLGDVPGEERGVAVAVDAADERGDVDVDDVAVAHHRGVGDAVADDLVEGGAAGLGEAAVPERRGVGAQVAQVLVGDGVDPVGGGARDGGLPGLHERVGGDPARDPHLLDRLGVLDLGAGERGRAGLPDVLRAADRVGDAAAGTLPSGAQGGTGTHRAMLATARAGPAGRLLHRYRDDAEKCGSRGENLLRFESRMGILRSPVHSLSWAGPREDSLLPSRRGALLPR